MTRTTCCRAVAAAALVLGTLWARGVGAQEEPAEPPPPAPAENAPDTEPAPAREPTAEATEEAEPQPLTPAPGAAVKDVPDEKAPLALELGGVLFKPTAEVRPRLEVRINRYAADPTDPDEQDLHFITMRSRIGLSAEADPVRLFVQIQDVRDWGAAPTTGIGGAFTGLHQGYLELSGEMGWIRAGRQEMNYGKQRMIGALNWATQARSFDGVRLHGIFGDLEADLMGAYLTSQRFLTTATGDVAEVEGEFLVTFQLTYVVAEWLKLQPYVLYRHDDSTEDDPTRYRNIASPGLRVTGKSGGFDYDVEAIVQGGKTRISGSPDGHIAAAAVTELGYRLDAPLNPAFRAGGGYASGSDPNGELDELDNFFPTNHMHYGFADLFGLRNLLWGFLRGGVAPDEAPVKVTLAVHLFGLADPGARWSNAGGATLGQNLANENRFMGGELDLSFGWTPIERLKISGGYSLFLPAQGAENLGNGDPTHWMFLMAGARL